MSGYPIADFDDVRRLRVLVASTPGATIAETVLDAPFEQVWAVAGDLEHELGLWLPDIKRVRITARHGERIEARITGYSGLRAPFDIVLRPGWCLMQSRFILGGMAAVAEGDGTRFASFGAFRHLGPAGALLRLVARPLAGGSFERFAARVALRGDITPGMT